MTDKTAEDRLIDYALETASRAPAPEHAEKAVHCLLDALSLARSAADHPVVVAVSGIVAGSSGDARSWTTNGPLSAADAALVNGTAVHAFFQDDTDMSAWGHPASLVPPAVVAAAQAGGVELPTVIRAMIAGYAAFSWLAAEEDVARALVESGFRASPSLGSMAAAVGAGVALGLDAGQLRSALGIAADSTGGTLEPVRDGAQDWRLQNGFAAQRGTMAALLAQAGVRGPSRPLTGLRGFHSTYVRGALPATWSGPPRDAAIMDVWFKPYPILGDNMAPAVAASSLTGTLRTIGAVESVTIRMNAHFASYPGTAYSGPFTRTEQMIASTAFGVAAILTRGAFTYADYDELIEDRRVLDLAAVAMIEPREDFGYLDGEVVVRGADGELMARVSDAAQTLFFRDRAATTDVLFARHGEPFAALAQSLFAAVDGQADWPTLGGLLESAAGADVVGRSTQER